VSDYNLPEKLAYTVHDEWVRRDRESVTIGVSDYAQDQLGDIVFVELPEVGSTLTAGEAFGVIESVKAVSDLYAPISGEVLSINPLLEESPETVNEDCYGDGWLIEIEPSDDSEFASLLDAAAYAKSISERED